MRNIFVVGRAKTVINVLLNIQRLVRSVVWIYTVTIGYYNTSAWIAANIPGLGPSTLVLMLKYNKYRHTGVLVFI